MKLLVIIAEYNPFHQGHKYHLEKAMEETGASHSMILMGGNFLQRGQPAIEEKFIRARKALDGGADLVAELPFIYASSWARDFAQGAVAIINKINLPITLSFGSETGDLETLKKLLTKVEELETDSKRSFGDQVRKVLAQDLKGANDVLGLEYLRALKESSSVHQAHTLKRKGQAYHQDDPHSFPSASSIRRSIKEGKVPLDGPVYLEDFRDFIYSAILTRELKSTYGMIEGLDNRLVSKLDPNLSIEDYIKSLISKKYRPARISRLLIHHMLGYSELDRQVLQKTAYLRPLAYTKKGTQILAQLKDSPIEIVHPLKDIQDVRIKRSLELDLKASQVYNFIRKEKGEDYKRNLLYKKKHP